MDFEDAMANLPTHTNIAVNDYGELADADIVISAIGKLQLQRDNPSNDRFIEYPFTQKAAASVAGKIKDSGFNGILIVITNPVDAITSIIRQLPVCRRSMSLEPELYWTRHE